VVAMSREAAQTFLTSVVFRIQPFTGQLNTLFFLREAMTGINNQII